LASDVDSALRQTIAMKEKLLRTLEDMNIAENRIEEITKNSFHSFLSQVGQGLGYLAGTIAKIISDFFR
jgi:hypothetical protein